MLKGHEEPSVIKAALNLKNFEPLLAEALEFVEKELKEDPNRFDAYVAKAVTALDNLKNRPTLWRLLMIVH